MFKYVSGPAIIDHVSAKESPFFFNLLTNLYNITKFLPLLQNLMGFLLQVTGMGYYILS